MHVHTWVFAMVSQLTNQLPTTSFNLAYRTSVSHIQVPLGRFNGKQLIRTPVTHQLHTRSNIQESSPESFCSLDSHPSLLLVFGVKFMEKKQLAIRSGTSTDLSSHQFPWNRVGFLVWTMFLSKRPGPGPERQVPGCEKGGRAT